MNVFSFFAGYHLVKTVMWRYGYGATFFYRTRFLSFPVVFFTVWYNIFRRYPNDLKSAGVFDYSKKKVRFEKDMHVVQQLLSNRSDYLAENKKEQISTTNI